LRRGLQIGAVQVGEGGTKDRGHRLVEAAERKRLQRRALGERAAGLEAVGQVHDFIEPGHVPGRERVTPDGLQHAFIAHAEEFASEFGTKRSVQNDRVLPLECIDRYAACFALCDQPFGRVETGQIVQHARQARAPRILAVALREPVGQTRNPGGMRVAMRLTELRSNRARKLAEVRNQRSVPIASASARSSMFSRLR